MALTYQWYEDSLPVGDNTSTYTGTAAAVAGTSDVYCEVSNEAGLTTSDIVVLTVVDLPVITAQPVAQTVGVDDTFTFTITATG